MQTDKLGSLCFKIGSGATPRGGSAIYISQGVSLIRSQNIYNDGFKNDGLVYIDKNAADSLMNVEVKEYDNLLNITGDSVARSCIVPNNILPARVNQHVAIIRPDPSKLDFRFLHYLLTSEMMQNRLLSLAGGGATRKALTKAMIEDLDIPQLPISDQCFISHYLGSLDDKIEINRRMNKTLEAIARAIFKSWFIDFDPVRAKSEGKQPFGMDEETAALFPSEFEDSELGEIPKSWQCIALSDICTTQYGYTESATTEPVGPHFLRVMDINKANWVDWQEVPYCHITPQLFEKYQLYPGDIVVARMADPGKSALIEEEIDAVFASYLVRLKFDSMSISNYIYHFLKSNIYKEYCECVKSGSVQSNMNAKVITGVKLILPPSEIIEAFYQFISPMRRKIINNVAENATLAEIRDALLPKLLSGDIRVPLEAD